MTIIALTIAALISSIAIPATRDSMVAARGRASTANLRIIEAAKREFSAKHPRATPSMADIAALIPGGIPAGPHAGEIYNHVTDLDKLASSSVNGLPDCEPWARDGNKPLTANGFNDLGAAARPVFVYIIPQSLLAPTVETNIMDVPPNTGMTAVAMH